MHGGTLRDAATSSGLLPLLVRAVLSAHPIHQEDLNEPFSAGVCINDLIGSGLQLFLQRPLVYMSVLG